MREAKGHFTFFFSGEEKSWRRGGRVAWGGHDFPEEEEKLLHRNRETLMHWSRAASSSFIAGGLHRNRGKYGLHLLHRTVCIKCPEIRCTACRYRFIYCCTFFEDSTAWFISVRSVYWHEVRGRSTAYLLLLYGLFIGTNFEGGVRPAGAVHLHLFCTEKEKCVGWFAEYKIFQTLWRSLPVEISWIFPLVFCPVHCW